MVSFLSTDLTTFLEIESTLLPADTTNPRTLLAAQVHAVAFGFPRLANTDTIDHHVQLTKDSGGGPVVVSAVTVPAGAGSLGVDTTEVSFEPFQGFTNPYPTAAGVALAWRVEETINSGKSVTLAMSIASY